ncbi:MAG: protein phosphatase CheZ [Alphaproteobacteria bacterium]
MPKSKVRKLYSAERLMLQRRGIKVSEDGTDADAASGGDLGLVLKELRELKALVALGGGAGAAPETPAGMPEISTLKDQLKDLHDHIEDTKREIASIRQPGEEDDRLTSAAMELGAIVDATEQATHSILNATEEIDELVDKLKERSSDVGAQEMMGEINSKTIAILEACNFQDISGQRTNKVVKTINYLEERILSMIEIWGAEGFKDVVVDREVLEGDAALLQGPQMEDTAISQDDVDALFD